jgi:hypothetical protein
MSLSSLEIQSWGGNENQNTGPSVPAPRHHCLYSLSSLLVVVRRLLTTTIATAASREAPLRYRCYGSTDLAQPAPASCSRVRGGSNDSGDTMLVE